MLTAALKQSLFQFRASEPATVGTNALSFFSGIFGNYTSSGVNVNQNTSLTLSAVYNAATIISNDFAKLPKGVFKKTADGKGREYLSSHPVKYLISKKPNQYMTSFQFDKVMILSALFKGNAYAYIERNAFTAKPIAFQYIDQDKTPVEVYKFKNQLFYKFDGKTVAAYDMIHIPGFSFNGITGIGVIKHAANSLGVSLAAQNFSSEYYSGKAIGAGVLSSERQMDPAAKTRYSTAFTAMMQKAKGWAVPVIDEGMTFSQIKISAQEAQFLLASKHGINEVARWFNLNPVKLGNIEDANNSISEYLQIDHINDSILPWAIKFQQEYDTKLFTVKEQKAGIYTKFNTESLLNADKAAQSDYWSKMIYAGVYSINEVRALLDMNPVDGGDVIRTPVNSQTPDQVASSMAKIKTQLQNG